MCKCLVFEVLHSLKSSIYRGNFLKHWNNEYYFTLSKKFSNGPSDILSNISLSMQYPFFTVKHPLKQSELHLNFQTDLARGLLKLQNKDIILLFPLAIRNIKNYFTKGD